MGSTAATWGYNTTTNLLSQIKGAGVQQYDYNFSGTTRNLTSRTNTLRSKTESFYYDTENLDRLTKVIFGSQILDIAYDPAIKGNIAAKTDAGTYGYDPTRKYALKTITNGLNISTTPQSIVYNAFNKVKTITEGTKTADFVYNADRQRVRMTLQTNGVTTRTRYYFGGSCEREVAGSATTQYIWIGGDAYTAVAVATKEGAGSWTVYNIFRDHLGTISHLKTGSTIIEYSFDAWGRRRNKDDWSYTLTNEPALFADRGFTGHEFLADFNLYNMNGRLYDPVVGRFLSPDPFIADPSFSQSYNRYAYCLNNPLKYIDPDGEFLLELLTVIVGNYVFSWLDNVINKHMSPKDAFRNTNFIIGVNFSPTDMSRSKHYGLSNSQVDAFKAAKHEEKVSKELDRMVAAGGGDYDDIPLNPAIGMGERIVGIANSYVGSTDYNLLSRKDDFLRGNPKCNKFVYDVLLRAGASPGLPNQPGRWGLSGPKPPIASQWANTNYSIPGWVVVNSPFPGDVASFNGHVGIVIGNGLTISATLYDGVVRNDWGFRSGQTPVFRRFVGYSPYY